MKTKLIFTVIALFVAIISAQASIFIDGLYYNLDSSTKTAEVTTDFAVCTTYECQTSGKDLNDKYVSGDVVIPETITYLGKTYSVTRIDDYAFGICYYMTSITIPESVTSIGDDAFWNCSSLKTITIPNSVTSIGDGAFDNCSSLRTITIQNGVTSIGDYTFYGCSSLTSVTIPNSVTSIGRSAFRGCSSLRTITIPNGVTSIGDYTFYGCSSLTSVTIPNSVTSIGNFAFYGCEELETMVLGNSIKYIDAYAFSGCKRLADIYCYAERVPDIYGDPFYNISRKATLWVPANRLKNYQIDNYWGEFDVQPMSAEGANTDKVVVTPDYNTADVIWPSENNADTYELIIKDKDGNEICSLIFNSIGQLQSIAFRAPAVDKENAPEQVQDTGFRFTITGLDSGSQYSYTITAKDVAGKTLQTYTGTFYTLGATCVDDIVNTSSVSTRKVVENGNVYLITPDGRKLNMQGAEVK